MPDQRDGGIFEACSAFPLDDPSIPPAQPASFCFCDVECSYLHLSIPPREDDTKQSQLCKNDTHWTAIGLEWREGRRRRSSTTIDAVFHSSIPAFGRGRRLLDSIEEFCEFLEAGKAKQRWRGRRGAGERGSRVKFTQSSSLLWHHRVSLDHYQRRRIVQERHSPLQTNAGPAGLSYHHTPTVWPLPASSRRQGSGFKQSMDCRKITTSAGPKPF